MRRRTIAFALLSAVVAGTIACNAILDNELGHLDDAGATIGDAANVDADADVDADANDDGSLDAAPWSPTSFGPSLALWLDGELGISTAFCSTGQCATIWADQSGNHNDAHAPSSIAQPKIVQLTTNNARHALHFDGSNSNLIIADSRSMEIVNGFTILVVASETAGSPHTGSLFSKTAVPLPFAGPALWINYDNGSVDGSAGRAGVQVDYYQYLGSREMRLDEGVLRVYSTTFDGNATLSLRVNDGAPASVKVDVTHETLAAPGISTAIGGGVFNGQVVLGNIAEVVFATRSVDIAEWTRAYEYLKTKYALP